MRFKPGDLVGVKRELNCRVVLYSSHPISDDAVEVGKLEECEVGLIVTLDVTHLGIYVVYILAPRSHGWTLTAGLKKL